MGHSIEGHSIMAQEDAYYQFPIRALNMGKKIDKVTEDEAHSRHQQIVDYCLVDYGTKNSVKAGREHASQVASDFIENKGITYKYNPKKPLTVPQQAAVFLAADRLGVVWPTGIEVDLSSIYERHSFINGFKGGNMQVRLRQDIFWDLKKMGWREWSILCGIYAMLGGHPSKVRICYSQINALSLGFNSVTQIGSKLKELTLTPRQTQITVDKLRRRLLFSKYSINGRHNWYSHKPQTELENMVIDTEVLKQKRRLDESASESTARGKAEVLRRLKALDRESAKAELAQLKNKPSQVGKA
jgi:hypothetical protein